MQNIVFVTSNQNKVKEISNILGVPLRNQSVDIQEIQSMDLEEIVREKAKAAFEIIKEPVLVEDVGLYLEAWNGFPGPFIKWLYEVMGYDALVAALPKDNRRVRNRVLYCMYDGNEFNIFEGVADGTIAMEQRGENGWGFDYIFIPDGETETWAEMGKERKLLNSPRRKGLEKLKVFLENGSPGQARG